MRLTENLDFYKYIYDSEEKIISIKDLNDIAVGGRKIYYEKNKKFGDICNFNYFGN